MNKNEFKKTIRGLGYMTEDEVRYYIKKHPDPEFTEEDIDRAREILIKGYVKHKGRAIGKGNFSSKRYLVDGEV